MEEKGITASIHHRNVTPEVSKRCKTFVQCDIEPLAPRITASCEVVEAAAHPG